MSGFHVAIAFAVTVAALPALAAQRTFVSTGGEDANACSVVAPCRSFGAAIVATDDKGEIVALDSGGYGRVTIDKSVTIQAPAGVYAGISVFSGTNGIDIDTAGVNVVLRGLSINGQGGDEGIHFASGDSLRIERSAISNMATNGILASAAGGAVTLDDVLVSDSGGIGVLASALASFVAERLTVERSADHAVHALNIRSIAIRTSRFVKAGTAGIQVQSDIVGGVVDALVEDVLVQEAQATGIQGAATASGSKVTVAVMRSSVIRSGNLLNAAIRANGSSGIIDLTLADSLVEGAGGVGVGTLNPGAKLTLANSAVVGSAGFGLFAGLGTLFYTRLNNTVRGNNGAEVTSQTSGTITSLPGL